MAAIVKNLSNMEYRNSTLSISTGVAVLGILVHLLLANDAFSVSVWGPPASNQFQSKSTAYS